MREIRDEKLLNEYLEQYQIRALFDTQELPFLLCEYEPGEMMNFAHPTRDYLKFTVKGTWNIYYDSSNGRRQVIHHSSHFALLGDLEFCSRYDSENWQEASTTVHCVELPLAQLRETLLRDNRFLRFLLQSLSEKMIGASSVRDGASTLEENLLYYLRHECPGHAVTEVEQTAMRLHYSRRQLQRVLKSLTQRGMLKKEAKGRYVLLQPADSP